MNDIEYNINVKYKNHIPKKNRKSQDVSPTGHSYSRTRFNDGNRKMRAKHRRYAEVSHLWYDDPDQYTIECRRIDLEYQLKKEGMKQEDLDILNILTP